MPSTKKPTITLLMGPTGSGKSALAIRLAQARPSIIINADAMQLVSTLRVITARPTEQEEAAAEHALYGVLPPESPTSVAVWLALVEPVIRRAWAEGKEPLLVGGTGMYLKALMDGLAAIPAIPDAIREKYRAMALEQLQQARVASHGEPAGQGSASAARVGGELEAQRREAKPTPPSSNKLYALLAHKDPIMAAQLKPGDTQRLARALEVIDATGTSLIHWQTQKSKPLFPGSEFRAFHIDIHRPELYGRIDRRFTQMMAQGALDEARALLALNLPPDTPITKAHGIPELTAHLRGEMSLEAAITRAQQHTRNYAKRQLTWIRNQMPGAVGVGADAGLHAVLTQS
jgi:tRNA dimethylallyltransferase